MNLNRRIKLVSLAFAAVMALGVVVTSAANAELAPRWKMEGSFLSAAAVKLYSATLEGTAVLEVPGLLTLESTSCSITGFAVGSFAKQAGSQKESVLSCEEPKVKGAPSCLVENVVTQNMKGVLGWMEETGESNILTFESEFGNLTTISIEGCALEGEYPVTGATVGTLEPAAKEVLEGTLRIGGAGDSTTTSHWFTGATTSGKRTAMSSPLLQFGGRPAKLSGTFDIGFFLGWEKVGVFAG